MAETMYHLADTLERVLGFLDREVPPVRRAFEVKVLIFAGLIYSVLQMISHIIVFGVVTLRKGEMMTNSDPKSNVEVSDLYQRIKIMENSMNYRMQSLITQVESLRSEMEDQSGTNSQMTFDTLWKICAICFFAYITASHHNINRKLNELSNKMNTMLNMSRLGLDYMYKDRRDPDPDGIQPILNSNTSISDENMCTVCQDQRKDCVLLPCRHMCTCTGCARDICTDWDGKCPLCRTTIAELITIFN
ncbi:mitochondrial ubiquitin ligase activator of NFKB 1-like [Lytechinus variegatus]|uniref:mitochondrial ubiquitin ligase activator of NFKB 1-like n=1 Tax=Lytechinus variegatus TaxID=7654 RepID=UPI001BB250EA|nr:mitochondrial ubiquitin ligase activator of NFKB 1-like [Lytechinus variegatus]